MEHPEWVPRAKRLGHKKSMRRRSSILMMGNPQGDAYEIKGSRLVARLTNRWDRWREKRANKRALQKQLVAAEEIRSWLDALLG